MDFFDTGLFDFLILPLLIIIARIADVSLDTVRVIMISKGFRRFAPLVGFFQVMIWIITITRIMENLDNWLTYVAYAVGFASGTYIGMVIEEKIALGYELIRVITRKDAVDLIAHLREKGYPVTSANATGRDGEVGILFVILKRRNLGQIVDVIKKFNPNAFYAVEDIRFVSRPPQFLPGR